MMIQNQTNKDIRRAAADAGFYLWQIAEELGMADGTFSRKLRNELNDSEKDAIFKAIERMKAYRDKRAEG